MTTMIDTLEINKEIEKILKIKVQAMLKNIDISSIINERIDEYIKNYVSENEYNQNLISYNKINWEGFKLRADSIAPGTITKFNSTGIQDNAEEVNLTVLDGQVIVEQDFISTNLEVVETAQIKNLEVDSITIYKDFNIASDSFATQMKNMIDTRINHHAEITEFNLKGNPLKSDKHYLMDARSLGPGIIESNLRKLGRLTTLAVTGTAELAETMVVDNGRVGINTDEPSGILSLWDEESELTIRKYKQRTMYLGGARDTNLVLGVNGDAVLRITPNGVQCETVKIGNISITCIGKEPTDIGAPGDLAINQSAKEGSPWAWRCMGSNRWLPLK